VGHLARELDSSSDSCRFLFSETRELRDVMACKGKGGLCAFPLCSGGAREGNGSAGLSVSVTVLIVICLLSNAQIHRPGIWNKGVVLLFL
jgi:hypothetical protein